MQTLCNSWSLEVKHGQTRLYKRLDFTTDRYCCCDRQSTKVCLMFLDITCMDVSASAFTFVHVHEYVDQRNVITRS